MQRGRFVRIAIPVSLAFLLLNSVYLGLSMSSAAKIEAWFVWDFPRLDTLYMVEAWPSSTARTMAKECKIDVFLGATTESDVEALKDVGWAVTHSGGARHYCYFGFNCREEQPPWSKMWGNYHGRTPGFNLFPLNVSSFRLALCYIVGCEKTAWLWDLWRYIVVRNDFPMPSGFGEWRNPYIMEYPEDWAMAEDILLENGFTVDKAGTDDRTHWIWYCPLRPGEVTPMKLVGGKNSASPGSDRLASPADGTMGIYVMSPPSAISMDLVRMHIKKWNLFFVGEEVEGIVESYVLFHHDIMAEIGPMIDTVWYNRNHDIFYLCGSFSSRNPSYLYYTFHSSQDVEDGDNDPGLVNEGLDKMLYAIAFFKVKDFDVVAYNLGEDPEIYIPASTHYAVIQPENITDIKIERCAKTGVYYEHLVPGVDYELVGSDLHILKDITLYVGDALEVNYDAGSYLRALSYEEYRDVVWLAAWKIFYLVPQLGSYSRDYFDLFKPGHEGWVEMPGYGAGAYDLPWTFGNIRVTGIPIGGSIKWQNEGDVVTLNPIKATWVYEYEILNRIIEGLITRYPYNGQEMPWIALKIEEFPWSNPPSIPDGQRIRLTIRDDVTWQDGTPVTSADIKWNFDYIAHVCPDIGTPMPEFASIWSVYWNSTIVSPYVLDIYVNATGHWKTLDYADVALTFPEVIWSKPSLQNYSAATAFKPWAVSYQSHVGHAPPNGLEGLSCLFGTGPFFLNMTAGGWNEANLAVLSKYPGYWKRLANPADFDMDMDVDDDDRSYFYEAWTTYNETGFVDVFCDFDGDCDIDEDDFWWWSYYWGYPMNRDLAVSSVEPCRSIVVQASAESTGITSVNVTSIDVKIDNKGDTIESFYVTLYADSIVINQTEVSLINPHTSQNITLQWNFTGFAKGNYTIKAYIEPKEGEWSTEDNTCTSWVVVTWLGDSDGDLDLDEDDVWQFCAYFITYFKSGYKPKMVLFDFDGDFDVDENDLWTFCAGFIDYYKAH